MKSKYMSALFDNIPEEWKIVRLGDVAEINKESKDPSKEIPNDKFIYIDIESIEGGRGVIKTVKEIIGKNAPSRARRVIYSDDIIMSTVRPYLKAFAMIPKKYNNQICSTGFAVLSCKEEILPYYLLHTLFSKMVIAQCNRMMVGGQYPALNQSQVADLKILLPPISEQKKIAKILSTVDDAIQKVNDAIAKTRRLKKGMMQEFLTKCIGHERFKDTKIGRIPEEWEVVSLGDLTKVLVGYVGGISEFYVTEGEKIPLLSTTNISENGIKLEDLKYVIPEFHKRNKKSQIFPGDIIIARHGISGSAAVIPDNLKEAQCLNTVIVRNSEKFESEFIGYLFNFKSVRDRLTGWKSGSVQGVVNTKILEKFKVPLPPLREQRSIAEIIGTIDKKLKLERERKEKLERIKIGLMNDLLTGRKRVKLK